MKQLLQKLTETFIPSGYEDAIRAVIRDDKVHQIYSLMQAGKKFGMQTMNDSLYQLYMSREVTKDECLRVSANPSEFLRAIGETPMEEQAIAAMR